MRINLTPRVWVRIADTSTDSRVFAIQFGRHVEFRLGFTSTDVEPVVNTDHIYASATVGGLLREIGVLENHYIWIFIVDTNGVSIDIVENQKPASIAGQHYLLPVYGGISSGGSSGGVITATNVVRVDTDQSFSAAEQAQGRSNINAVSAEELAAVSMGRLPAASMSDVSADGSTVYYGGNVADGTWYLIKKVEMGTGTTRTQAVQINFPAFTTLADAYAARATILP